MRIRRRWDDDEGFATVAAAVVIAALAALMLAMAYLGAAVTARHRAQNAADLAALAGAAAALDGSADPCRRAGDLAGMQDGSSRVQRCELDGQDVLVSVAVPVRLGFWGLREATARARAGPAE